MAKELILLPKRKYEELLKSASVVRQEASKDVINENIDEEIKEVEKEDSTQTGNGMYVEKTSDVAGTPGILDQPQKKNKKEENKKSQMDIILTIFFSVLT